MKKSTSIQVTGEIPKHQPLPAHNQKVEAFLGVMRMRKAFFPLFLAFMLPAAHAAAEPKIIVYKSPTCGCCSKWEDHLRTAGFQVESKISDQMDSVKKKQGIPAELQSCHTGVVSGYVIEGHVPATSIKKLLALKPKGVKGLAVPGMPMGSPGMEGPYSEKYDVIRFEKNGKKAVFDSY